MIWNISLHGADHRDIVDAFPHPREKLTDFNPALPVPLEFERRRESRAGLAFRAKSHRKRFASVLVQERFGIERIDVRSTAIQEKMNDPFCAGREMRCPREQRIDRLTRRGRSVQQVCKPERADAQSAALEETAAR